MAWPHPVFIHHQIPDGRGCLWLRGHWFQSVNKSCWKFLCVKLHMYVWSVFCVLLSLCILNWCAGSVWSRGNFCYPLTPLSPHFLAFYSYLIVSFTFFFFPFLFALSVFLLFHPFPMYQNSPTLFQAGCRRMRLNLALVFRSTLLSRPNKGLSNVRLPIRPSVHPRKVSSISMKFVM